MDEEKELLFVFRADREYIGFDEAGNPVPMMPKDPSAPKGAKALITHVSNGDSKQAYISTSLNIATMQKYNLGKEGDHETKRARVYLIALDKMPDDEEYKDDSPYFDFRDKRIDSYIEGSVTQTSINYTRADSEVTVGSPIMPDRIHEVHPFLVDLLCMLDADPGNTSNKAVYNNIIKIIYSGEFSVEAIENALKSLLESDIDINSFERDFFEQYYSQRAMIDYKSEVVPNSLFLRQCIRTDLLRKITPALLSKLQISFDNQLGIALQTGFLQFKQDDRVHLTSEPKNPEVFEMLRDYVVKFRANTPTLIPNQVEYTYIDGDRTQIDSWITSGYKLEKEVGNNNGVPDRVVLGGLNNGDKHLGHVYYREHPEERMESINANRYSYRRIGESCFAFGPDGVCVKVSPDDDSQEFPPPLVYRGVVTDEKGRESFFDPLGYDRKGFDVSGTKKDGLLTSSIFSKRPDDIRTTIQEREKRYREEREAGIIVPELSPVERTLIKYFDAALSIVSTHKTPNKDDVRKILWSTSFGKDLPEELDKEQDSKLRTFINILQESISKESMKNIYALSFVNKFHSLFDGIQGSSPVEMVQTALKTISDKKKRGEDLSSEEKAFLNSLNQMQKLFRKSAEPGGSPSGDSR
jgi:hypothetical protein